MKKIILLLFTFSFSLITFCDAQFKQGELAIGGTSNEGGYSIVQSSDKGYVIAGQTNSYSAGTYDVYAIKLDSAGNLKWTRTIGGLYTDEGNSIIQTSDKGFVIAGYTESFGAGAYDVYVIKLDSAGNLKWTKTVGGARADYGYSVVQTYDKGFAIAGLTDSYGDTINGDMYVIKLDSAGNLKWTKTIGGPNADWGYSIIQTRDKGLAIVGGTDSYGMGSPNNPDVYVVKLDSAGNLKWTKTIGGASYDECWSIIQTSDKGLAIAGYTLSYGKGNWDVYVFKLDSAGNLKWTKTIGGTGNDEGYSIIQTNDKGLAITGWTDSFDTGFYEVKLDSAGALMWTRTIGGAGNNWGNTIIQTTDKGFAIAGYTTYYGAGNQDILFIKLDSAGNSCNLLMNNGGIIGSGGLTGNGGIVGSGGIEGNGGYTGSGGILSNICQVTSVNSVNDKPAVINLYPNPNNGAFTLSCHSELVSESHPTVDIYNTLGQKVYSSLLSIVNRSLSINISSQPSGIYLYRVTDEKGGLIKAGKLIIEHECR